ncbi:efflux RND transporter periplasmic adaptor subunit [Maribacter sp. 2304DJ31-5]|uniref:efflux RND transporter periplasmic adaptor subunit n=1 Tax=Maribacter sp. 2304DJ31-5 TaxID=3386273 RepID=UPI0039BC62AB
MKIPFFAVYGAILCIFCLVGCKDTKSVKGDALAKSQVIPQINEVNIQILKKRPFQEELLANGRLVALQKNVLKFEVNGALEKLYKKNGEKAPKGQALAVLGKFKYQQAFDKAELALKKAALDFEDMLVGRGYDLAQKDSIPNNIYEMAAIRSGYRESKNRLADARFELDATTLRAPFGGKIANIQYKQYEQVNAGTEFMTLIDDSVFEVEFYLIESEMDKIKLGQIVEVLAFGSEKEYEGRITSINPLVEENGTVLVKARIKNNGVLLEGMNVKVRIQKDVLNQFVVPKEAVILRQNQEVLFKYQSGKTYWTYVQTIHENSRFYAIIPHPDKSSATLVEGDTIIVSNNLNLAHDVEVTIK